MATQGGLATGCSRPPRALLAQRATPFHARTCGVSQPAPGGAAPMPSVIPVRNRDESALAGVRSNTRSLILETVDLRRVALIPWGEFLEEGKNGPHLRFLIAATLTAAATPCGAQCVDYAQFIRPVGSAAVPTGSAEGVAVSGSFAFVAHKDFSSFDVGDPTSPTLLTTVGIPGAPAQAGGKSIHLVGDLAYAAFASAGLAIFDVGNPAAPSFVGGVATPNSCTRAVVVGDYAYLADEDVHVADVSDPTTPVIVRTVPTPGDSWDVATLGNVLYAASTRGIQIIDISIPTQASIVDSLPATEGNTVEVTDSGLLLAYGGSHDVHVYDTANPVAPTLTTVLDVGGHVRSSIHASGDLAFLGVDGSDPGHFVTVLDVADPRRSASSDARRSSTTWVGSMWRATMPTSPGPTCRRSTSTSRAPRPSSVATKALGEPSTLLFKGTSPICRLAHTCGSWT